MHELADAVEAAAPPRANARRIAEWVNDLARDALTERKRKLARVENWETEDLPLRSGPFTAELPLRPASSQPPPEVFEANVGLSDLPPAPPLPVLVTTALSARSSPAPGAEPPATVTTKKTKKTKPESAALEPAKKGSLWWLWLL